MVWRHWQLSSPSAEKKLLTNFCRAPNINYDSATIFVPIKSPIVLSLALCVCVYSNGRKAWRYVWKEKVASPVIYGQLCSVILLAFDKRILCRTFRNRTFTKVSISGDPELNLWSKHKLALEDFGKMLNLPYWTVISILAWLSLWLEIKWKRFKKNSVHFSIQFVEWFVLLISEIKLKQFKLHSFHFWSQTM